VRNLCDCLDDMLSVKVSPAPSTSTSSAWQWETYGDGPQSAAAHLQFRNTPRRLVYYFCAAVFVSASYWA
jgi:hypothetical protein